jgi:hypothetical protein
MDIEEAEIIIEILKTGSKFYQPPFFDGYEDGVEGTFIEYRLESDDFVLKRYEKDDWAMHKAGYDETIPVSAEKLLGILTGKVVLSYSWWGLTQSNNYVFDFEKAKPPKKTTSQKILEMIAVRDLSSLVCSHCNSRHVEPTCYATAVNIGGANRYVSLNVKCLICGKESEYAWDD